MKFTPFMVIFEYSPFPCADIMLSLNINAHLILPCSFGFMFLKQVVKPAIENPMKEGNPIK